MRLYGYWRSTAAYRVRIALNVLKLNYESVSVHLVKDGGEQHHTSYDKINPNHLVPTLIDGDIELNQSLAIIEYLDECYGVGTLVPADLKQRALVRAISQDIACDIHPINNLRVVSHLGAIASFEPADKAIWMDHWMSVGFTALERRLIKTSGLFCVGDMLTMADICLVAQLYNANRFGVSLEAFPVIKRIEQHCLSLEVFQRASPQVQPDANR